jgi:hypothetical protein
MTLRIPIVEDYQEMTSVQNGFKQGQLAPTIAGDVET